MRTVGALPPDHAPIRWEHLNATKRNHHNRGAYWTKMPNGWYVYDGPRLVEVLTYDAVTNEPLGREHADHATLLRLLWDRMGDLATNEVTANNGRWSLEMIQEYTVLSAAFDLVESDLDTGSSLASWRGPREMVDLALTLATSVDDKHAFVQTRWQEF
jgi:hypothetical protein